MEKLDQNVAMTRAWFAPTSQHFASQLLEIADEVGLACDVFSILGDGLGCTAALLHGERIGPFGLGQTPTPRVPRSPNVHVASLHHLAARTLQSHHTSVLCELFGGGPFAGVLLTLVVVSLFAFAVLFAKPVSLTASRLCRRRHVFCDGERGMED
eukprot:m.44817 g.44817  ORF g.44817 m.44817 type:complete len:155 (+) comp10955_c0_seq1:1878-2342(+)